MKTIRLLVAPRLILSAVLLLFLAIDANARSFRPGQLPGSNGNAFSCSNCHISPFGGGARNPFGEAVLPLVNFGGGFIEYWSPTLAAQDSDNDGFTNGQEVGDVDGDGVVERTTGLSNPGDAGSLPVLPNTAPAFTSSPIASATIGLLYQYQATANDADGDGVTFAKLAGPAWLGVSGGGLLSGTPQDGDSGSFTVMVQATDDAATPAGSQQTFSLVVGSSFAGWQNLHFDLPSEMALSAAGGDADNDGFSNLEEYVRRLNPRMMDTIGPLTFGFDPGDRLTLTFQVRDDDVDLGVNLETTDDVKFKQRVMKVGKIESDPTPNDGLKTLIFTDTETRAAWGSRFARLRFELDP
jgi:hypothetical protein